MKSLTSIFSLVLVLLLVAAGGPVFGQSSDDGTIQTDDGEGGPLDGCGCDDGYCDCDDADGEKPVDGPVEIAIDNTLPDCDLMDPGISTILNCVIVVMQQEDYGPGDVSYEISSDIYDVLTVRHEDGTSVDCFGMREATKDIGGILLELEESGNVVKLFKFVDNPHGGTLFDPAVVRVSITDTQNNTHSYTITTSNLMDADDVNSALETEIERDFVIDDHVDYWIIEKIDSPLTSATPTKVHLQTNDTGLLEMQVELRPYSSNSDKYDDACGTQAF